MTTTLNQLVFELLELRRAQLKLTDPVDRRLVIDWIQSQRARLLKQAFTKPFIGIDNNIVQDLGTVALEQVSANDLSITDYRYMLRTAVDIPATIERRDGTGTFTRVGPPDKLTEHYKVVPYEQALVSGNGHFNSHMVYAFTIGERLYLISKSGYHLTNTYVHIRGVFQNPIEAAQFADATWTYDDEYPINKSMIDQLKTLIVQEKFGLTLVQAEDKKDDSEDNLQSDSNASVQKR